MDKKTVYYQKSRKELIFMDITLIKIIARTFFFYFFVIIIMKLMGKRQLNQLQLSEFVITLLLSEIAADPITNTDKPIWYAIIPIFILFTLEIIIPYLATKSPKLKNYLTGCPALWSAAGNWIKSN